MLTPAVASAQIRFPKTDYYAGLGDRWRAGGGAPPVTNGYVYQLYDHGVFGQKTDVNFANLSVRSRRTWELRDNQVPQILCTAPALRPTMITITAGANDFLRGDTDIAAIAFRVVQSIDLLLHNASSLLAPSILDPVLGTPCAPLTNVTILVSNYYHMPVPFAPVAALLDAALAGFDQAMRAFLPAVQVPAGSKIGYVDLYSESRRTGLVLVERRLGFAGPFDFDIHPTNLGHTFIAQQLENVFKSLQQELASGSATTEPGSCRRRGARTRSRARTPSASCAERHADVEVAASAALRPARGIAPVSVNPCGRLRARLAHNPPCACVA